MFSLKSSLIIQSSYCIKILLVLALILFSVKYSFSKAILYDGRDGLSSNDISAIIKDDRGMMWIGTYNGLNIYDGYSFTKFLGGLSNLHITSLAINNQRNELLVGTTQGLYAINLTTFKLSMVKPQVKGDRVWSSERTNTIFIQPGTNRVYVAFGHGYLACINEDNNLELVCRISDTGRTINHIVPADNNHLIVNNGDIYEIDLKRKISIPVTTLKSLAPFNSISSSGDTLLLNTYNAKLSMVRINTYADITPVSLKGQHKILSNNILQSRLKHNKLYILCQDYTFLIMDMAKGTIDDISKKYPDIFEGKIYYSLFIDEHDIIWIATNKGLIKVEERPKLFARELYNFPSRISTRQMLEDETGDIYISSYIGLWHFSKQARTWTKYVKNSQTVIKTNPLAYDKPVQPLAIFPVPDANFFYLGFDSEKLLRFDKRKKIFERINYTNAYGSGDIKGIYTIASDKQGILWLGCTNGLASYHPVQNKLILHRKDVFSIGQKRVRFIYSDSTAGILYVGTSSGLYVVDISRGLINHISTQSQPALSNDDVLFIHQDPDKKLWLGTNGGGINILSADLKSVTYIHKQNGLSNEIVYSIIPQDTNTFWISTFNGLDRYRKDLRSFSNFFEDDGLSSDEFNQNSFLKTREGKIYFGSINGVTSFYPQQFSPAIPFSIFISGISKWDDKSQTVQLLRNKIGPDRVLIKRPSDLLFELHFGCTDYTDPLRNSYSYRIRELSDNWISLEDRHTLNLGGIPYGNYTLEVKAINSRGASSQNVLLFHITVTQTFYKTWWFFMLILSGLAIIFYIAYQIKYQNFKSILHLRMKIASNLHDEVGSLLTRITMFSDNLRYSKNNEEQRNSKLEKIALLSRNATASMSDVLWAIDSRNDFAGNLLDRMREHTEEMLFPLGIDVNFVLSETDLKQPISSDIRGEVYLIFKEAINNIVKHSQATKVDILYQVSDRSFLLNITNNGVHEDISELSTGQGLSNMKMRAAKIGAAITVQRMGDTFSVVIKTQG